MKQKEYIQAAGFIAFAVVIGLVIAFAVEKSGNSGPPPASNSGDVNLGAGTLQVVNSTPDQGNIQSNGGASVVGLPDQSSAGTSSGNSTASGSSLQNTGAISQPTSSGLQGGSGQ